MRRVDADDAVKAQLGDPQHAERQLERRRRRARSGCAAAACRCGRSASARRPRRWLAARPTTHTPSCVRGQLRRLAAAWAIRSTTRPRPRVDLDERARRPSATQTSAGPAATSSAPLPTCGRIRPDPARCARRCASRLDNVRLVTHSSPPTTASAFGRRPTCADRLPHPRGRCPTPGHAWRTRPRARPPPPRRRPPRSAIAERGRAAVPAAARSRSRSPRSTRKPMRPPQRLRLARPSAPSAPRSRTAARAARPRSPADGGASVRRLRHRARHHRVQLARQVRPQR